MTHSKILAVFASLAIAAASTSAPARAQVAATGVKASYGQTYPGTDIDLIPAVPFTWSFGAPYTGPVRIPVGNGGGWFFTQDGQWRFVISLSGDPTMEVILYPPASGHPTKAERFLVQFPLGPKGTYVPAKGLVIGFHPFNVSEQSSFLGTPLPAICRDRRWILLSPLGLSQINFGNTFSQESLDAVLAIVAQAFPFDQDRIYTVGFSMGGINAVSWAMRHLDSEGFRVAGVVDHTGVTDAVRAYNGSTLAVKTTLENDSHFAGTPSTNPFAYDRVSPLRLLQNHAVNPDKTPVVNLASVPFYIHYNLLDPNVTLIQETQGLIGFLQSKGAKLRVDTVSVPGVHWWSTLDMYTAMNWIGRQSLSSDPPSSLEVYADSNDHWLYSETRDLPASTIGRYEILIGSGNDFTLDATHDVATLAFDLPAMGLDPMSPLTLMTQTGDASTDVLVLQGYEASPSQILDSGGPITWSYNRVVRELRIEPANAAAQITIDP